MISDSIPDRLKSFQRQIKGLSLLLASISIALAAQISLNFAVDQPYFWDVRTWGTRLFENSTPLTGLLIYFLAGCLFIYAMKFLEDYPDNFEPFSMLPPSRKPRFGFWITSLGLAILTAVFTSKSSGTTYALSFGIVGCVSIYLLFISVFFEERWRLPSMPVINKWVKENWKEILTIILILMIAFFARFIDLEIHPYSFINDEGEMGRHGACLIKGTCVTIMETGWSQQPMLAFLPYGISVALLGNTAVAVRLVSVITGCLAVLAVYFFSREVFDKNTAWVAALLISTLPVHIHFSRLGVDNIVDSLSTAALLWLLFRGLKNNSTLCFFLAGLIGGLSFYTYPGSRLAPVIGILILGFVWIKTDRFLIKFGRNGIIFLFSLTVTAAPILGFFSTNPESFAARMNSVGIFQTGTLQSEVQNANTSPLEVLVGQFMKSSLVFIATDAPSNFFNSPKPYLTPYAAVFFMLGLAYTVWRIKDARFFGLLVWFWAAVILGSTITGGPPTSQRMLMSMPPLAIITALAVVKFFKHVSHYNRLSQWLGLIGLVIFLALNSYQNLNFYFSEYRAGHYFEDPTNELTYETQYLISPLHRNGRLFLLAEPGVPYLTFASFNFFSPDVEKAYLDLVTPQTVADLPTDKDILFIATPARKDDLNSLASGFPGGEYREFYRRTNHDQILFYSYKVPRQSLENFIP